MSTRSTMSTVAHIHYKKDTDRTWRRTRKGSGFFYHDNKGHGLSPSQIEQVEKLVIPPAWRDVVISPFSDDYIQAQGTDSDGRRQYIYHPDWIAHNQAHKFDQMVLFGERLPALREVVRAHMREHTLTQERVLATLVWLLEHTFIRVGNREYAEEHGSYGLTTLREKHVTFDGNHAQFHFIGKSGVFHELDITQPRVVQTIKECIEIPGYELFQYVKEDGGHHIVDSGQVNDYLQEHMGADFSAKDFRTWGGSVMAGESLYEKGWPQTEKETERNIVSAVTEVSQHLGNTRSVCRAYYIHPTIIQAYEKDFLIPHFDRSYQHQSQRTNALTPREYAAWSLIRDH